MRTGRLSKVLMAQGSGTVTANVFLMKTIGRSRRHSTIKRLLRLDVLTIRR